MKHQWYVIAIQLLAFISAILVAAVEFEFITNQPIKVAIYIALVISLLINFILSFLGIWPRVATNTENVVSRVLDLACLVLERDNNFDLRSNIFLLSKDKRTLEIRYHSSNMSGVPDLGIKLEKWQGCTGHCWGYGAPTIADLTIPENEFGSQWGMTEDQIRLTENLGSIFSIPIINPSDSSQIVGILSFDSEEPIADYFYENFSHNRFVQRLSNIFGSLLSHLISLKRLD